MSALLIPEALTAAAFAPFGDVIEAKGEARTINYGVTERFHDLARIDCGTDGGRAIVSLFRSRPPVFPFALTVMENHPLSSQCFMPLSPHPFLVVVAPRGPFARGAIRAFRAAPDRGSISRAAPGTISTSRSRRQAISSSSTGKGHPMRR